MRLQMLIKGQSCLLIGNRSLKIKKVLIGTIMKNITLVSMILVTAKIISAKPELKLPFPGGEEWQVSQGYNPDDSDDSTHRNYGLWADDRYALDFNLPGDDDLGKPIISAATGLVETIIISDTGYGNNVMLNHGDGYKSRYAHLESISVSEGQQIYQGQEVGKCGTSGLSTGPHLHFTFYYNGVAELPEPMSGYSSFTEGEWYISDNYCIRLYLNGTILV